MRKYETQKLRELLYGRFFVEWINKEYKFDYKALHNEEEYSDIDVFGVSRKKEKLNLQMVTSNGETFKLAKQNSKKIGTDEGFDTIQVNLVSWLEKAIADKNNKHYSKPEELIIIIEGFLPTPSPEEVKKTSIVNQNIQFKGIYYVSLPVISLTNLDYEKNGYVVTIKKAFDFI